MTTNGTTEPKNDGPKRAKVELNIEHARIDHSIYGPYTIPNMPKELWATLDPMHKRLLLHGLGQLLTDETAGMNDGNSSPKERQDKTDERYTYLTEGYWSRQERNKALGLTTTRAKEPAIKVKSVQEKFDELPSEQKPAMFAIFTSMGITLKYDPSVD
jgi:hypothetical protein